SGCTEMGVRLLLSAQEAEAAPPAPPAEDRASGKAYLLSRRGHYARMDRCDERTRAALERLRETFTDHTVAFTGEAPRSSPGLGLQGHGSVLRGGSPHPPRAKGPFSGGAAGAETRRAGDRAGVLVSASFLVRRRHVAAFRETFRRFQATSSVPALLSGPWPPYSFAGLEGNQSAASYGE
ncbi:MAG: GvpL/GvpF family gas vesicle protein, partial [Phycisphaerae bacterium]